jgi:glycerol-3-phosphate dehydrogenase (NAD(P)+)
VTAPKVAIVGAGAWGTTLAVMVGRVEPVVLLAHDEAAASRIAAARQNERRLPGIAAGANPLTFAGLAGIGGVVATCGSPLSRNHRLGVELAKGRRWAELEESLPGVAEGAYTVDATLALARRHGVEMPIAQEVHNALFEGKSVQRCLIGLLARESKDELAHFPAWAERIREDGS